jgi:hypothetical protein
MHPYYYYRNAQRNIPPNQYYVASQSQIPPNYPYYASSQPQIPLNYPYYEVASQPQKPPNYPYYDVAQQQNPPSYSYYEPYRNLPPVDTKMFIKSAKCIQNLMNSANVIVDKFASSPQYCVDIMTAAQYSNQKEVEKLIHSLGLKDEPVVKYTPDGITIDFDTSENNYDVCHMSLKIRWG